MGIYLDNAATTKVDEQVRDAILPFLNGDFGNPSAIHCMGRPIRAAIEKIRKSIAVHINASPSEVFFTSCGTEANNTALLGCVVDLGVEHIITSKIEHHCILHFVEYLEKKFGTHVHYLDVDEKGHMNMEQLEELLKTTEGKTLVSLMHANNEIGTMIEMTEVANLCQEYEALFHSDTVQTFAHFPFDVQETKIDFIACSAHKFHGPKGVGFLYIKGEHKISPLLYGGAQERNMRAGTENVMGIAGLGKAVELAYEHLEEDRAHIEGLKMYMAAQLQENFEDIQFNGDWNGRSLFTVLNVSFPVHPDRMLLMNLDVSGVCASGGSACSSGTDIGSHVLNAIGADPNRTAIRFSFSKYSTKEEIDTVIGKLKGMI